KDHLSGPGGCARLLRLRLDHDSQRHLLQVPELRQHERLLVTGKSLGEAVGPASPTPLAQHPSYSYEGPYCPCCSVTSWDGHTYRSRGWGFYYERSCH